MAHLRPRQEYVDQYDKLTVDDCRWRENFHKSYAEKHHKGTPVEFARAVGEISLHFDLLYATLKWLDDKETTIEKWMESDRRKDHLLEIATAPEGVRCLTCHAPLISNEKFFWGLDDAERVLFLYPCPNGCLPHRTFFNTGEEYRQKPHLCPKCGATLNRDRHERKDNVITTTTSCGSCDYTETSELDLSPKKEEPDPEFEKDRARFCLSGEAAQKTRDEKFSLESMARFVDEMKEKEKHADDYAEVRKLRKLTVVELEKLLTPLVEQSGYVRFTFGTPDAGSKDLFLPFTVYDEKEGRSDRQSSADLSKTIRKALEDTSWRLMSDGISYRLGILSGRLRAYEREEDLLALVRATNGNK